VSGRPTRLILIRHAEPDVTLRGRCYGSLDVTLSTVGRNQAAALAADLANVEIAAVYTSPLARARETAAAIAARQSVPLLIADGMRELDFGACEGRSYEEIARTMPGLYEHWMSAPATVEFPEGESFAVLSHRAVAAAVRIRAELSDQTAVVVTHGGVCRALLADVLGLPVESIFRLDIGYARASVIDWHRDEPVVRLVNGAGCEIQLIDADDPLASNPLATPA
jgi:alpha-ribazole phosphatase